MRETNAIFSSFVVDEHWTVLCFVEYAPLIRVGSSGAHFRSNSAIARLLFGHEKSAEKILGGREKKRINIHGRANFNNNDDA